MAFYSTCSLRDSKGFRREFRQDLLFCEPLWLFIQPVARERGKSFEGSEGRACFSVKHCDFPFVLKKEGVSKGVQAEPAFL